MVAKCYRRLIALEGTAMPFNWTSALQCILASIGETSLWQSQSLDEILKRECDAYTKLENHLISLDINRALNSTYNPNFRHYSNWSLEPYLKFNIPIAQIRIIAQLRLEGIKNSRIFAMRGKYIFDVNNNCPLCNLNELDTIQHLILN